MANIFQLGTAPESLTDTQKQDLAKIAILEATITGSVQELTPGETIQRIGSNRLYSVGGVKMLLAFNGASAPYVVPNPITAADLAKWAVTSQYPATATNFPANAIVPAGFQLQYQGSIRRHTATRMTGAAIDLANWEVEVPSTGTIDDWIKNAGDDHAAGEKLFKADDRRISVGGVGVRITYRGADIDSCPAMSLTEIANWEYISQSTITSTYPASVLAPKGFLYRRSETLQVLELSANAVLPAAFDAAQWTVVSQSSTTREVNSGSLDVFDALAAPENVFVFRNANIENGPANSVQNSNGILYTAGDSKNGVLTLTVTSGDNIGLTGGTWSMRVSTPAPTVAVPNPVTTRTEWTRVPLEGPVMPSTNNAFAYSGSHVLWDLSHTIKPWFLLSAPLKITPKTDWSTRTGSLDYGTFNAVGSLPTAGTEPVSLTFAPARSEWVITQTKPTYISPITVHNAGTTTTNALKAAIHAGAEAHIEGGADYSIAATDWFDGQSIRFVHTAGTSTTEKLTVTGFAGAYLRNGFSRDISGGLFIGRQDTQLTVSITQNGTSKYLNIEDRSQDAHAIWDYPAALPANQTGWGQSLISFAGGVIVKANAIAPNAVAATHFIDVWAGLLTPLYGDGCLFTLPANVAGADVGADLYLGANGSFSLAPPTITPGSGDLRQPVAVVARGGRGRIKFRAAAKVV